MDEAFGYESPPPRELLEHYGVPEDVIDGVLGMHAHELAEKIREDSRQRYSRVIANIGATMAMRWMQGREDAADLIDSEVT